jgi:outer membrane protein assembly factor BamD
MKNRVLFIFSLCLLITLSACKFQKTLKSGSADEKYDLAIKLYESKDYSRALQLFDQLTGAMRATDKSQKIAYYYPFCYYYQSDFTLAAYYFTRYANTYPTTAEAEECMYMSAYCNFLNSPEYSLDQTITYDALKELQLFTNTYPTSKKVSECNDLIDKLRLKLEMKDYRMGKVYFKMSDYVASITVFNNILKDYPETPHKEEILFLIAKSSYKYANESIFQKQKERYSKTILACNELLTQFPGSRYSYEVTEFKERSVKTLETGYNKDQKKAVPENGEIQLYKPKK